MSTKSRFTNRLRGPGDCTLPPRDDTEDEVRKLHAWPCEECGKPAAPIGFWDRDWQPHRLCVFCAVAISKALKEKTK